MLHKTQGIVLSHIKYRETSVIVRLFTEAWGLQSYIVHGVRTKKPKYGMALFQPLTLLDLVVYRKKQGGLQRIAELKCHRPNSNILGNIKKAAIAVFLAELLAKVVREEDRNERLFHFVWQSVMTFDQQTLDDDLFYLRFLLQLGHCLGFGISSAQDICTQLHRAGQHDALTEEDIVGINRLINSTLQEYVPMTKALRRHITEVVMKFYQLHIDSLDTLRSLKVLQAVSG